MSGRSAGKEEEEEEEEKMTIFVLPHSIMTHSWAKRTKRDH